MLSLDALDIASWDDCFVLPASLRGQVPVLSGQRNILSLFDDTFFQDGAPFFGPVENLRFKFRAKVTDKTGELAVTIWTEPAEEMLQISSDALAALWYDIGAAADPQAADPVTIAE